MGGLISRKKDSYNVGNSFKAVSINKTNRTSNDNTNQFRRTELVNDTSEKSDIEIIGVISETNNIKKDDGKTVRIDESKSVFIEHQEFQKPEPPRMSEEERKIKEDVLMAIVRGEMPPETSLNIKKDESVVTQLEDVKPEISEEKKSSSNNMDAITVIKDEMDVRIPLIDESDSEKKSPSNDLDAITVMKDDIGERIPLIDESDGEIDQSTPKNVQNVPIKVDISKYELDEDSSMPGMVSETQVSKISNEDTALIKVEVKRQSGVENSKATQPIEDVSVLKEVNEESNQKRKSEESAKSASSEECVTVTEKVVEAEVTALCKADQVMEEVKDEPVQRRKSNEVIASEPKANTTDNNQEAEVALQGKVEQVVKETPEQPVQKRESNESGNPDEVTITKKAEDMEMTTQYKAEQVVDETKEEYLQKTTLPAKEENVIATKVEQVVEEAKEELTQKSISNQPLDTAPNEEKDTTKMVEKVELTEPVAEDAKEELTQKPITNQSLDIAPNKEKDEILYFILGIEKETNRLKEHIINFSSTSKNEEYEILLETLIKNIIKLDDISYVDDHVRNERKRVIKIIQQCIQNLEKKIDKVDEDKNNSDSE